jgi:hypothetical protein
MTLAGGEDDAAELPPVPVKRSAALAECNRIQFREPVAAVGAEGNRQVVADQLAAAAGEDGRPAGETCLYYWLLLAEGHPTRRLFRAMLRRIESLPLPTGQASHRAGRIPATREAAEGRVLEESTEREAVSGSSTLGSVRDWPMRQRWRPSTLKAGPVIARRGRGGYATSRSGIQNGNSP